MMMLLRQEKKVRQGSTPIEVMSVTEALLRARPEIHQRAGLTRGEAEDLLDWLENNGFPPAEAALEEDKGYVVRWPGSPHWAST